jgi:hypothetical protein
MPPAAAAKPRAGEPTRLAIALALGGALALLFGSSAQLDFYGDDFVFLDRARIDELREIPSWFSLERNRAGMLGGRHAYRPLSTNVWFGTGLAAFGPDARSFHVANLLLAWVHALLVARLLEVLGCTRGLAAGLALATAASTIGAEAQLWLSVVQDLLASVFVLACALAFERSAIGARGLALAWLVAGLLSKETASCTPLLLLAIDRARGARAAGALARRVRQIPAVGAAIAVLIYLALRLTLVGLPVRGPYALGVDHVGTNLVRHLYWSAHALFRIADPLGLSLAGIASAAVAGLGGPRSRRLALCGLAWYAAALAPVSLLRAHAYPFYLTLPSVGLAIAAAGVVEGLRDRLPARARIPLGAALLAAFLASSHARFEERRAALAARSALTRSVIAQWRERFPVIAPGSQFYFELPPGLPRETLFIGDGAALRVAYRDPSLRVYEIEAGAAGRSARRRDRALPLVRLAANGRLEVVAPESTAPR